ncbi:hypothetical protein EVAR_28693_1 [Eumeta japonica]|uniref:C2H2-type domain-containing protein n=1 Tax=Eumeta variegata TaxID=151549 RepID=A0A4C1V406_EUMVA|nr:hypothetical protein EVAR_28693_1 [Eumeta japonica]
MALLPNFAKTSVPLTRAMLKKLYLYSKDESSNGKCKEPRMKYYKIGSIKLKNKRDRNRKIDTMAKSIRTCASVGPNPVKKGLQSTHDLTQENKIHLCSICRRASPRHSIMTRSKKVSEQSITTMAVLKTVTSSNRVCSSDPDVPAASVGSVVAEDTKENKKSLQNKTSTPGRSASTTVGEATRSERIQQLPCAQYNTDKGYRCPNCQRCYNARKNLVRHVTLECGREPQYKCPHCSYSKHRRNELKKHIERKHAAAASAAPRTAHAQTVLPDNLPALLTLLSAHAPPPLAAFAPPCGPLTGAHRLSPLAGVDARVLAHQAHTTAVATATTKRDDGESEGEYDDTDDIVLPEECDPIYAPAATAAVAPAAGEPVDVKPPPAATLAALAARDHDDPNRQFECRHCGKKYRWKSTLRRHENVECGGKPPSHQCPYCSYRAKQRGNLGVHIRKHHNNEWYLYASNRLRRPKKEAAV